MNGLIVLFYVLVDIFDYCKVYLIEFLFELDNCVKFFNCSEFLIKLWFSWLNVVIGKFGYECFYLEFYDIML